MAVTKPEASLCQARSHAPGIDRRRRPERTLAYRVLQGWLTTWLAQHEEAEPVSVAGMSSASCAAIRSAGFWRMGLPEPAAPTVRAEFLIAFWCKGRGVCPSCTTKRMVATAAHRVDAVIPRVPGSGCWPGPSLS